MACPTVWIFSASSSGMESSNSSSNSMTSSTVSRESALRSLMKWVSRVISLLSTPICSLTISMTFCSVSSITGPGLFPVRGCSGASLAPRGPHGPFGSETIAVGVSFATAHLTPRRILLAFVHFTISQRRFQVSHDHSTVGDDHLPGDVSRVGTGEKRDDARDLGRVPETLERDHFLHLLLN